MENRKFIIVLIIGLFLILHQQAQAYHTDTHEYLTQEAIHFYNNQQHNGNELGASMAPFLIDGARREDDPPRWMNHFYDPVYNRGLSEDNAIDPLYKLGNWESSKEWAVDSVNQKKLTYSPIIGSILSLFDRGKIEPILTTSDFTWEQALKHYIQGDKEGGLFALGHILHLMQDASVPDHTRNDPHADGSPYETYAKQFTIQTPDALLHLRLASVSMPINNSLNDYFVQIATYTNNNFYSKDTIGIQSGYSQPEPDYFLNEAKYSYGYVEKPEKHRIVVAPKDFGKYSYLLTTNKNLSIRESDGEFYVLNDYWSLLSKKAIAYSAGVIDLFFKEVAAHQNDPQYTASKKQSLLSQITSVTHNAISKITTAISSLFNTSSPSSQMQEIVLTQQSNNNIHSVSQPANAKKETPQQPKTSQPVSNQNYQNNQPLQKLQPPTTPQTVTSTTTTSTPPTKQPVEEVLQTNKNELLACPIPTKKIPLQSSVIFNEVAWMGTTKGAANEWIELKNTLSVPISISGWSIQNASGNIQIKIPEQKFIAGNNFFLLERGDDDASPAQADIIYTGSLRNSDEELYLFDASCNLMDYIAAQSDWPSGISADRRTMERDLYGLGWHTSSRIDGTPKTQNSNAYKEPTTKTSGGGASNTTKTTNAAPPPPPETIRINEIMYNPIGADTKHEWIELYNTSSTPFDLTQYWKLNENNANHAINEYQNGKEILGNGYAIIADDAETFAQDHPEITAPIFDSAFSLNNSGETIAIVFDNTTIHTLSYTSSTGAYEDGNSLQYSSVYNTWISATPTPGLINIELPSPTPEESATNTNKEQDATSTDSQEPENPQATSTPSEPEQEFIPLAQHAVISEIYPDKNGTNQDFIEIYNPTDDTIALANYKLKILKENATSTESLAAFKDADLKEIPPHGYYLVGFDQYASSTLPNADVVRSASLPSSKSATVILTYSSDELDEDILIDEVLYDPNILEKNQSFERKAWINGQCVHPSGDYEFAGNGCDAGAESFVVRNNKNPQNTNSLIEPRPRPQPVSNFIATYNQSSMRIQLTWDDTSNATGTVVYEINAQWNDATTTSLIATTTAREFTWRIYDIHTDYHVSVHASDADGYQSEKVTTTISVPGFIHSVDFYNAEIPTIDLHHDTYPFIPSPEALCQTHLIAVYLNNQPTYTTFIREVNTFNGNIPVPQELSGKLFPLSYRNNRGYTTKNFLVLRNSQDILDISLRDEFITATGTHVEMYPAVPMPELDENSYLTFAFYDCILVNWGNDRTYQLVAVDNTKYYFSPPKPTTSESSLMAAPTMLLEIDASTNNSDDKNPIPKTELLAPQTLDGTAEEKLDSTAEETNMPAVSQNPQETPDQTSQNSPTQIISTTTKTEATVSSTPQENLENTADTSHTQIESEQRNAVHNEVGTTTKSTTSQVVDSKKDETIVPLPMSAPNTQK